jgi:hypothetical protein
MQQKIWGLWAKGGWNPHVHGHNLCAKCSGIEKNVMNRIA